jgi:hypothetical protein
MAGVVMLARYGLVSNPLTSEGHILRFVNDDLGWGPMPDAAALAQSFGRRSRIGWWLVLAGLAGQFVGVWIPQTATIPNFF